MSKPSSPMQSCAQYDASDGSVGVRDCIDSHTLRRYSDAMYASPRKVQGHSESLSSHATLRIHLACTYLCLNMSVIRTSHSERCARKRHPHRTASYAEGFLSAAISVMRSREQVIAKTMEVIGSGDYEGDHITMPPVHSRALNEVLSTPSARRSRPSIPIQVCLCLGLL